MAAQTWSIPFPETCDFISINSLGIAYLGTTTGLYRHTGTGSPDKIDLSGLDNTNVQSNFFEDQKGNLWFCTYNRIIGFNPVDQSYEAYALIDSNGDTLHSDYYVFDLDLQRNELWVKQEKNIYAFNTKTHKSSKICDGVAGRRLLDTGSGGPFKTLLSYYYVYQPRILVLDQQKNECVSVTPWKNWPTGLMANDMIMMDTNQVLIATGKGLFIGDVVNRMVYPLPDIQLSKEVKVIGKYAPGHWIIYGESTGLKSLHLQGSGFELKDFPVKGIDHPIHQIVTTDDGTVFLSSFNRMIYFLSPQKVVTRDFNKHEVFPFTGNKEFDRRINRYIENIDLSANGTPFIFNDKIDLYTIPPYSKSILKSIQGEFEVPHPEGATLYRYFAKGPDIYGSFVNKAIYKLKGHAWEKVHDPSGFPGNCNYYYPINDSISIASVNMEKMILWNTNTGQIRREFIFSGDIHNQVTDTNGNIYFSTDQGILIYDNADTKLELRIKTPSPCYCLLKDADEQFWFSSKNGIYNYNPLNESFRKISGADGSFQRQYAERKCIALNPDSLLFYYEDGISLVIPSLAAPSEKECNISITDLKINDLEFVAGDTLSYGASLHLPYTDNTLSFEVRSIDWSDPLGTDLKYRLDGYDDSWVQAGSYETFIRYAKLPPGHYTLQVQGRNADGVWNKTLKEVAITIKPPFWMTWWFISLAIMTIIGIIYFLFRSYYQRKLEKKNIALREQAQIIRHQQELEHERTRIAAEMHDDLGSGLTTIRYLSDKALLHAKDSAESEQIQRIAEHSNRLVRNMSEIIWAMNSRFDDTENLTGYLRRYASEFLSEHQMPLEFSSDGQGSQALHIGGEKRRNIFLVFKEMLHNSVKYSGASKIKVHVASEDDITITIDETGAKGFDPALSGEKGNGLYNAQKRMDTIDGRIRFAKTDNAMRITITVPLEKASHG